jgi:D-beta-D-heptose 7-phosphate kinase / D-beta-D-heptose 1-phosphate adenosyltransferase
LNENQIRKLKSAPILVAGDVMVDEYIIGDVERISPESPVPVVVARDRLRRLGGAGNVVRNLVTLGGSVALFATVGKDNPGRWFRKNCEEMAVESFWLKDDASRPTTIKTRVVARNQQLLRIDEEHVSSISREVEASVLADIKPVLAQVKAVIISDYGKGFVTPDLLQNLIFMARAENVPIFVDPKGTDFSKYKGATFITPNEREASLASGIEINNEESLVRAARVLIDQSDAEGIVITRGKKGSTLVTANKFIHFPVRPIEIVDVTGAGDTVIATLALAMANNFTIESAVKLSNLAARLVVSRFGAATVTQEEIIDSLKNDPIGTKHLSFDEISGIMRNHRMQGKKICFTNGCFDLLHPGHMEVLKQAANAGDILVVGINSDSSISRIKGPSRPIIPESDRVSMVAALGFVDYVIVFDQETPLKLIEEVKPDILVKGADWRGKEVVGESVIKSRGGKVMFVDLIDGISTTLLIDRIKATEAVNR